MHLAQRPIAHPLRLKKILCAPALEHCEGRQHASFNTAPCCDRDRARHQRNRPAGAHIEDMAVASAVAFKEAVSIPACSETPAAELEEQARLTVRARTLDAHLPRSLSRGTVTREIPAEVHQHSSGELRAQDGEHAIDRVLLPEPPEVDLHPGGYSDLR